MGKAQRDYTLSDVVRLKPAWLKDKQTDLENYTQHLSSLSTMMDFGLNDVADISFLNIFNDPDISKLSISLLNKALFEYREQLQASADEGMATKKHKLNTLYKAHVSDLKFDKTKLERELSYIREDLDSYDYDIREMLQRLDRIREKKYDKIEKAVELEDRIANNNGLDKNRLNIINSIPSNWQLVETDANTFTVVNLDPCIIKHTNAAAGINKTLQLGYFRLELSWDSMRGRAYRFADNIVSYTPHPHVANYICWGNVSHKAEEYVEKKQYDRWWKLLETVFTTYNSGNPFISMNTLIRNKNKNRASCSPSDLAKYPTLMHHIYRHPDTTEHFRRGYEQLMDKKLRSVVRYARWNIFSNKMHGGWKTTLFKPLSDTDIIYRKTQIAERGGCLGKPSLEARERAERRRRLQRAVDQVQNGTAD